MFNITKLTGRFCTFGPFISGDKESGKTTLIAKLQGNEDPKKGAGLEYGYINVRDEYREGNSFRTIKFVVSSDVSEKVLFNLNCKIDLYKLIRG